MSVCLFFLQSIIILFVFCVFFFRGLRAARYYHHCILLAPLSNSQIVLHMCLRKIQSHQSLLPQGILNYQLQPGSIVRVRSQHSYFLLIADQVVLCFLIIHLHIHQFSRHCILQTIPLSEICIHHILQALHVLQLEDYLKRLCHPIKINIL